MLRIALRKRPLAGDVRLGDYLGTNTLLGRAKTALAPERPFIESRQSWVNPLFVDFQVRHRLTVVPVLPRLCGEARCMIEHDGIPLYRDNDPLSVAGALYVKPIFDPLFKRLGDRRRADVTH